MFPIPPPVLDVLTRLEHAGYEAYIVGGCVRDFLLGDQPKDYDVTTSALPDETERVFRGFRVIETGLRHGTVTVLAEGLPVEITTYRVDGDYRDNRHPDSVSFTKSLREDAARRDFTMNAVACDRQGALQDFFGGEQDIENRTIRCVGDANQRFGEDALRVLRALRFSATLGFAIAPDTQAAIFACKGLLKNVSRERVAAELMKLLCGGDVRRVLTDYAEALAAVLPEILPVIDFDRRYAFDLWDRTAQATQRAEPAPALRMAALCLSLGKPDCYRPASQSEDSFPGYAERGAALAEQIATRLRLDNATRERVTALVGAQSLRIEDSDSGVRRALSRLTPEVFFDLMKLKRAAATECSGADRALAAPVGPYADGRNARAPASIHRLEARARRIIAEKQCFCLKGLALTGDDLLALGAAPGKRIGETLNALLGEVMDGALPNQRQALLQRATDYLSR